MKIFLDSSDVAAIREAAGTGLISGITTNPSIIAKSGRSMEDVIRDLVEIIPEHISVEGVTETTEEMVEEALRYRELGDQIVIKVPMTRNGLMAVPILEDQGIRVNVTMVFSATQATLAMKCGASFVSIVLSRLDAVATESLQLIEDTMLIRENYGFNSEIIAGSVKTQNHLLDCLRAGLHIATIPPTLFNQMYRHPLTDEGIEGFKKDWATLPK
jgi:transaldolase